MAGGHSDHGLHAMGGQYAQASNSNTTYDNRTPTSPNSFNSHFDDTEELRLRRELRDIAERNGFPSRSPKEGIFVNSPTGELFAETESPYSRDDDYLRSFGDYDGFERRGDALNDESLSHERWDGFELDDDLSESEVAFMMTCDTSQEGECEVSERVSHHFHLEEELWRSGTSPRSVHYREN